MLLVQGDSGAPFKLKGALTFDAEVGKRISALAVPEEHPKYGTQYKSDCVLEELPVDRFGVVMYLSKALKGVSKATAGKFFDAFGESVYDVIEREPRRLLGIGGVNEESLRSIVDSWAEDSVVRNILPLLARHGVSGAVAARIFSKFGANSLRVAKNTPYELTTVEGVGFLVADKIAAENGMSADSEARIAGALEYVLEYAAQQGNTSKPVGSMVSEVQRLTGLESEEKVELIESVIASRVEQGKLVARTLNGKLCLTPADLVKAERAIAKRIFDLVEAGGADKALAARAREKAAALKDAAQADAVANVFECPVSVITGRPGCGKTTVIKVIAEVAEAAGLRVVMAAPTGKAARRMTEATGGQADTVHSVLRPEQGGSLDSFQHDASNPLEGDLFVLDESSMMDTPVTRAYLDAIPAGARVVLVGDSDQLPSVGAGNVLRDLIASGKVPVARLQKIHRTALDSDIVVNAHRVINGDVAALDLKGTKDFKFVQAVDDKAVHDAVLKTYLRMVAKYGVDGVQVLAARRGTAVGVEAMNALLRPVVNPSSPEKPELEHRGKLFRLGDRVMRTSNNKKLGVSNGEVGIITMLDPDAKRIRVNFGDREVMHEGRELLALDLAYATTMHKSQGSEYDGVITLTPGAHQFMLNRNLVYTAMTRGKKESDIIGDSAVLRAAVRKAGALRCTGLAEEMVAAFGGPSPKAQLPGFASAHAESSQPAHTLQASPPDDSPTRLSQRATFFKRARP